MLRGRCGTRRTSPSCSGPGSATSPTGSPDAITTPYGDIPNWPASAVIGHAGKLVVGSLAGKRVAALSGRAHFYEGHDLRTVTFATRVMWLLGREDTDPHQCRRRHQHGVQAGHVDGDRRSHQPARQQSARRSERRPFRVPLSRHDRGLFDSGCARMADAAAAARGVRSRTASTSRCTGRATRRRPRSGSCARSAPTPSACRRCPRRSSHGRCAIEVLGISCITNPRPACCRSRCITTK